MNQTVETVHRFVRTIRARNVRETVVGVLLMAMFASQTFSAGRPVLERFANAELVLGLGVILFVLWHRGNVSPRLLGEHPPERDVTFWNDQFRQQAAVLREVPVWYLGALLPGFMLAAAANGNRPGLAVSFTLMTTVIFGGVALLNLRAAARLERRAAGLM